MLKEGHKLLSGLEEAVLKNIEALYPALQDHLHLPWSQRNEQDGDRSFGQAVCDE
jgi:hypothetical protein